METTKISDFKSDYESIERFTEFINSNPRTPSIEQEASCIAEMILEKHTPFNQNRIIQLIVKNIQDIREEKLKDIRRSESEMIEAMKGLNKSIRE